MRFTTKELSRRTWADFEDLFSRGNGWDHCACMAFQRDRLAALPQSALTTANRRPPTRREVAPYHRAEKKQLVDRGRAHGILVYDRVVAVGWCQFGTTDELTVGTWRQREDAQPDDVRADWRITCFVTDKRYRRRGIAQVALRAALAAIRRRGGGVVEATPIAGWHRDASVARTIEIPVAGIGVVRAVHGTFGNVSTPGIVSMFEREGFRPVGTYRDKRVVMRAEL